MPPLFTEVVVGSEYPEDSCRDVHPAGPADVHRADPVGVLPGGPAVEPAEPDDHDPVHHRDGKPAPPALAAADCTHSIPPSPQNPTTTPPNSLNESSISPQNADRNHPSPSDATPLPQSIFLPPNHNDSLRTSKPTCASVNQLCPMYLRSHLDPCPYSKVGPILRRLDHRPV